MKIKRSNATVTLDCKRLHLPFTLTDQCPECQDKVTIDLSDEHHLAYPAIDRASRVYFSCRSYHSWTREVVLRIDLELVKR